eukprot:TRINITY_DN14911_c0_g1_i1.p1 TRINITY_DN14911_c0_g1~~TRINITY_DN14911_c0_g1_i1.p1  ORF type:complete len:332 (+),score=99.21 TRINITY_DN14911_c0_g1_i1:47-1042(+)
MGQAEAKPLEGCDALCERGRGDERPQAEHTPSAMGGAGARPADGEMTAPPTTSDIPTPQVILDTRFMSLSPSPCAPPLWEGGSQQRGTVPSTAATARPATAGKPYRPGRLGLVARPAAPAAGLPPSKRVTFSVARPDHDHDPSPGDSPSPSPARPASPTLRPEAAPAAAPESVRKRSSMFAPTGAAGRVRRCGQGAPVDAAYELAQQRGEAVRKHHPRLHGKAYRSDASAEEMARCAKEETAARARVARSAMEGFTALCDAARAGAIAMRLKSARCSARRSPSPGPAALDHDAAPAAAVTPTARRQQDVAAERALLNLQLALARAGHEVEH